MALSVSISAIGSSALTGSPSLTSQRTISPSVIPSPTSGKRNCFAMLELHDPGDGPEDALRTDVVGLLGFREGDDRVRPGDPQDGGLETEDGRFADQGRDLGAQPAGPRGLVDDDRPARPGHGFEDGGPVERDQGPKVDDLGRDAL